MNIIKKHELQTLLPRGKIKKYMRMFDELIRQIPLGDKEKVLRTLNEEFAHYFSKDEEPKDLIEPVIIEGELRFQFVFHGSRLMIHTSKYDPEFKLPFDSKVHRVKGISPTNFIFEYCNPEGLIVMEKAFMNYI